MTKFLPEHTPQYFLHDPTFSQDLIIYQGKQRHLKGDIFHLKAFYMLISQFFFEIINLIFYSIYITYSCIIACFLATTALSKQQSTLSQSCRNSSCPRCENTISCSILYFVRSARFSAWSDTLSISITAWNRSFTRRCCLSDNDWLLSFIRYEVRYFE